MDPGDATGSLSFQNRQGTLGNAIVATSSPGVPCGTSLPGPSGSVESKMRASVPREGPWVPPTYSGSRGLQIPKHPAWAEVNIVSDHNSRRTAELPMRTHKISAARAVKIVISKVSSYGVIVAQENPTTPSPHARICRFREGSGLGITHIFPSCVCLGKPLS